MSVGQGFSAALVFVDQRVRASARSLRVRCILVDLAARLMWVSMEESLGESREYWAHDVVLVLCIPSDQISYAIPVSPALH